ncbi:MAG TPA: glycosyltransferase family 4 protein [Steroidobacteraceae bacterium]|jgi:glycosyltransferase involved in cell wall biosynthesis|nr:glycosyltransferase family 4 protein [Steroidobacteraceae bacterium]
MNAVASLNDRLPMRARGPSSRYRIAMVAACPMPARRGTPLRIERLSHALWSRGHQVELITYHIADDQQPFEFPVHRIFAKPQYYQLPAGPTFTKLAVYDPALAFKLWRVLARGNFDVIHAHHVEGLLAALPSRLHTRLPIVYDAHTMLASELPSYGPKRSRSVVQRIGSWFDAFLPRQADHVVAVTSDIQSRLVDHHGMRPDRVTVVTNGVEVERFIVPPPPSDGVVRIMYSGTLAPYQDIDLLLDAFARAWGQRKDLRLVFSVSSSFKAYAAQVTRLGIRDAIEVIPDNFENLPERLAGAAMAVLPRTQCPGIPQKLLNYMAAAKAIVSSAGSAKVIEHERTGLVVPNGDADAFAKAILRLAANPQYAQELGRAAREHVVASYSWGQAAERLEHVYEGVISSRAGHEPRRTKSVVPVDSPTESPSGPS